jgi:iron complex transport system permease protein
MSQRKILISIAAALAILAVAPWFGPEPLPFEALRRGDPDEWNIFFTLRLSRTLLAFLAGGSLAIAGALFQSLLRNSLATPYTLGVSSGAALGAVIAICFRLPWVSVSALVGAFVTLLLVLGLAARRVFFSAQTLVLAGVSITSVCSALITILHSYAGFSQSFSITTWLIGGVEGVDRETLGLFALAVIPIWTVAVWHAPAWNLLSLGDVWAEARGLPVRRFSMIGYLGGSWLAGITVAITGPIGFIGLLAPHFVRTWTGADHRTMLPVTALFGASFLAVCDTLGRTVLAPADVPAGVITAIFGGPGLIWILLREQKGTAGWR